MNTITIQATFEANDFFIFESLFKKFNIETTVIEEKDFEDFSQELSYKDIQKIEIGREQIKKGMAISSSELQKQTKKKYGNKMGY